MVSALLNEERQAQEEAVYSEAVFLETHKGKAIYIDPLSAEAIARTVGYKIDPDQDRTEDD